MRRRDYSPFTLCPSDESRDGTDCDGDHEFSEDIPRNDGDLCAMRARVLKRGFYCRTCDFCDVQICWPCESLYKDPEALKLRLANKTESKRTA